MEKMTVAQLKEVCKQKGIEFKSKATKIELEKLLKSSTKKKAVKDEKPFNGEH